MTTPEEAMFAEALAAARAGERSRARDLLTRLLKIRQDQPEYWLWMSAVVETSKERIFCLKEALRLDPDNLSAKRGLILAGALAPDPSVAVPAKYQKRNWKSQVILPGGMEAALPISKRQGLAIGGAAVLFVALLAFFIFGVPGWLNSGKGRFIYIPASSAVPDIIITASATATMTVDASSLSAGLKEPYTPTPVYINTPHIASEAFRIGLRAYQRGEWDVAQNYFSQSANIEPEAADVIFYMGETLRQQGMLDKALAAYEDAAKKNPDFAPAYLGMARVHMAQDPAQVDQALEDLETAIDLDADFLEAYIEMAAVQVQAGDPKQALAFLGEAEQIQPGAAVISFTRASVYMSMDDPERALENAFQAKSVDVTLLPVYRLIGQAYQAQGDMQASLEPLNTYLRYAEGDADAWIILSRAQFQTGDKKGALKSLDRSISLNGTQPGAYLQRGLFLLEDEESAEEALEDFKTARDLDKESFEASLGIAKALMALKYPGDAYEQIERSKGLAETETQKAAWQFWRAQSLEALGEIEIALRDYQAVLALPKGIAQKDWVEYAQDRVDALEKKTATPMPGTSTPSPTASRTPVKSRTPARTATP